MLCLEGAILADTEGYLVDDTLRIECLIYAHVIGTESAEEPSRKRRYEDVTLVVHGGRIYANKGILATHCEYFEGAFFGDFVDRNKEEHELPDVDPDEFEKFKAVIYPSQKALDGENIYAVVNLADRFGAKSLLDKCEEFMLEHLNAAEAFKGLSAYAGLDDLKSKFLAAMSDKELDSWTTPEGLRSLDKGNTDLVLLEYKNRRA
ncbi:Protein BATH-47 [Aphelenchoides avenae]|nr:Protein BATH-47 [Aphelenchus avenae]